MARRHLGTLALVGLITTLLWSPSSRADYTPLPDPPPRTTSQKLQPVPNLDRSAITVSGLSSGGFMAHQFHIAFSNLVTGAGVIAGGPFRCVEDLEPILLALDHAPGSGLGGHPGVQPLLWRPLLGPAPRPTQGRGL